MSQASSAAAQIPTQVHLAWLGRTVDIHWDRHAVLMAAVWFVLVPIAILAIRYFKPAPTPYGIPRGTGRFDRRLLWWTIHWTLMYAAIALALAGAAMALVVSRGFSGSVHAVCGLAATVLGALQIVSAWQRGSHGGRQGVDADPDRPETWRGDHYDMTPRRRWFEAWHRSLGYAALGCALAAAASGLAQLWVWPAAIVTAAGVVVGFVLVVVFEGQERRHDTYRSVYGNHPDHPYNRARAGR